MKFLICNAGSSSIKISLIEAESEAVVAEANIEWRDGNATLNISAPGQPKISRQLQVENHGDAMKRVLAALGSGNTPWLTSLNEIGAVGHRVVHGGDRYTSAVRITPQMRQEIGALSELAPLHNPPSLAVIKAAQEGLPNVPHVAAFDTAFHSTLSPAARTYALPHRWSSDWGIRRFGFHGLSHSYCSGRAAEMLGRNDARIIIAHLGNGASVSAVASGKCVDTTMGFTPLEGLMMGTRSGSVDPGILIYVQRDKGLSVDQVDRALNKESGLLGVSGVSSDMREVLAAEARGDERARLAIEVYVVRIQQTVGAMAAALGGVDALVFTAGVGERSAVIRQRVCAKLGFLGLELDAGANEAAKPDVDVATRGSKARILVIATREDLTVVREIKRII